MKLSQLKIDPEFQFQRKNARQFLRNSRRKRVTVMIRSSNA